MYSEEMYGLGSEGSAIRKLFAYGLERKAQIGADKVFDFSIGNPSVESPKEVTETFIDLLQNESPLKLHGYTVAAGDMETRKAIADDLNDRFGTSIKGENLFMTCGAAASLKIVFSALYEEGDEALTFAPFFPEYTVFTTTAGYKFSPVMTNPENFQPDIDKLAAAVNEKTKLILVNSPNNPSGVVYTEESIKAVAAFLKSKEEEYGHPIFIVSDEPYRELTYGAEVPFIPNYYDNTLVCYSYSKSLSLPGERIGYICVPDSVSESKNVYAAVAGAARALGYVCAPSILQKVIARCTKSRPDLETYKTNRDLLYNALSEYGYTCIHPDGAFYLCVKALEEDAQAFSEKAMGFELLIVPGDSFCAPGFVRISYCVDTDMIKRSLPAFKKLYDSYK